MRLLLAMVVASSILVGAPAALAQMDPPDPPHIYQDATGVVWGIASFQILTTAGIIATLPIQGCQDGSCAGWVTLGSMVTSLGLGLAAGFAEWPADAAFVGMTTFLGLGIGLSMGYGLAGAAGGDRQTKLITGIVGGALLAIAAGVYSGLRRDEYIRNPDVAPAAHLATWGTMGAFGLSGALMVLLVQPGDAGENALTVTAASIALAVMGTAFIVGEVTSADGSSAGTAPLLSYSGEF